MESLIDLIYNPGIINIDFADLRTILKGRGNSAFLNTIEESGKDRVEKTCENIFKNPLLQNSGFPAEKILKRLMAISTDDIQNEAQKLFARKPILTALGPLDELEDYKKISARLAA